MWLGLGKKRMTPKEPAGTLTLGRVAWQVCEESIPEVKVGRMRYWTKHSKVNYLTKDRQTWGAAWQGHMYRHSCPTSRHSISKTQLRNGASRVLRVYTWASVFLTARACSTDLWGCCPSRHLPAKVSLTWFTDTFWAPESAGTTQWDSFGQYIN